MLCFILADALCEKLGAIPGRTAGPHGHAAAGQAVSALMSNQSWRFGYEPQPHRDSQLARSRTRRQLSGLAGQRPAGSGRSRRRDAASGRASWAAECWSSATITSSLYAPRLTASLSAAGLSVSTFVMPAGEGNKRLTSVGHIYDACVRTRLDRESLLVALGGGVVGDVVVLRRPPICAACCCSRCQRPIVDDRLQHRRQGRR